MSEKLQFRVSSGLKNIIGRELITDDFIAIFELVKNSFDAHASEVKIEFENITKPTGVIRITDNGKGMSYDDLIDKWLFVAYSAKKDGTEDIDYRSKIQSKIYYAGAKGIGRFSCDKLGSSLRLITTKDEDNAKTEQIDVDWTNFDQDSKEEFINVSVEHNTLEKNPSKYSTGTILEISDIREDSYWNTEKLLKLKRSLAKLINPFESNNKRKFEIEVIAKEFILHDEEQETDHLKINGLVTNPLLELLKEKTIKIYSKISEDGRTITTELFNNGIWLYKFTEENMEYNLLKNIIVELYYLNRSAKNNFTRLMGVRSGDYGSVFLYKNGIRIYPYGEPGEDPMSLDRRQQKRLGDYFGTSELIGRIEILGENDEFKETTSRGDGLIKNASYEQMYAYFIDKVVEKIESFYRNVFKYGIDIDDFDNTVDIEDRIIKLISNISTGDNILSTEFNSDLISNIATSQEENKSAKSLIKSIEKIANDTDNKDLFRKIRIVKDTLDDAIVIADLAEEEIKVKDKEIKEKDTQNLFLKSIRSQEFDDLVSLMHHTGIYAQTINSYLKNISLKLNRNIEITKNDLIDIIRVISFEANKILNISEFATKANFRLKTEDIEEDIVNYISEYITNILPTINDKTMSIRFNKNIDWTIKRKFKPIEINILIDNIVANARKAKSTELIINLDSSGRNIMLEFIDNGVGINPKNLKKVYDFGYTTTDGSGLGLYHINEIIKNNSGKISINNNINNKGITLKILI